MRKMQADSLSDLASKLLFAVLATYGIIRGLNAGTPLVYVLDPPCAAGRAGKVFKGKMP